MTWPEPAQIDLGKNKSSFPNSKTILSLINWPLPHGDRGQQGEGGAHMQGRSMGYVGGGGFLGGCIVSTLWRLGKKGDLIVSEP